MTTGQGEHDRRDTPLGTTRGSLSTFLFNRSWRYRLAELKSISAIKPTCLSGCNSSIHFCGCHFGYGGMHPSAAPGRTLAEPFAIDPAGSQSEQLQAATA
jgi:hypothetical protein